MSIINKLLVKFNIWLHIEKENFMTKTTRKVNWLEDQDRYLLLKIPSFHLHLAILSWPRRACGWPAPSEQTTPQSPHRTLIIGLKLNVKQHRNNIKTKNNTVSDKVVNPVRIQIRLDPRIFRVWLDIRVFRSLEPELCLLFYRIWRQTLKFSIE